MKFVIYKRLSKKKAQGQQYGFESQDSDIEYFLKGQDDAEIIAEFSEYYSGKPEWTERKELVKAVKLCEEHNATLLVSKIDRLGRSVESVAHLLKRINVRVAVMPTATNMVVQILSAVAEDEVRAISDRITKALAVAKGKGVLVGAANPKYKRTDYSKKNEAKASREFAEGFRETLSVYRKCNTPFLKIAQIFNEEQKKTIRGKSFDAKAIQRLCQKLNIV